MALTFVTSYSGQGYTAGGQVIADGVQSGTGASNVEALVTITGDGAATTGLVPYIDGVQTIPFVPQAILFADNGGSAAASTIALGAITNAGFNVTLSAAPGNGLTRKVAFRIVR